MFHKIKTVLIFCTPHYSAYIYMCKFLAVGIIITGLFFFPFKSNVKCIKILCVITLLLMYSYRYIKYIYRFSQNATAEKGCDVYI